LTKDNKKEKLFNNIWMMPLVCVVVIVVYPKAFH